MTDQHEPDHPRSIDDDVDPAAVAWVVSALGDLSFLRPDPEADDASPSVMPDHVWQRLQDALAAEPAVTPATAPPAAVAASTPIAAEVGSGDADVVALDSRRQPSRAARWAGGLVAASVAVVAVGVGVTAFQGSSTGGGAVVAGDAPATAEAFAAAESDPSAKSGGAEGAASEDAAAMTMAAPSSSPMTEAAPDTSYLDGPDTMTFAGMVPPVLRLVQSDTDYTEDGLRGQVTDVLTEIGLKEPEAVVEAVTDPEPAVEMPADPMPGFVTAAGTLRDCITKLTSETSSTALMVDMATFEGQEAGVVVAPEYPMTMAEQAAPMSTTLEVWVVDPECDITMKLRLTSVSTP